MVTVVHFSLLFLMKGVGNISILKYTDHGIYLLTCVYFLLSRKCWNAALNVESVTKISGFGGKPSIKEILDDLRLMFIRVKPVCMAYQFVAFCLKYKA